MCRTWVRYGEEGFIATATLFRGGVPLGRAYIPMQALGDGRAHAVRVALHAVLGAEASAAAKARSAWAGEGTLGLSDADHNALLERLAGDLRAGAPRAAAAAAPEEGAPSSSAAALAAGEALVEPDAADAVGVLTLTCSVEPKVEIESRFARSALAQFDANADGELDEAETISMLAACRIELSGDELEALFIALGAPSDADGGHRVSGEALVRFCVAQGFAGRPMAFTLLSFLADGAAVGRGATLAGFSRVVDAADTPTAAGAGRLLVHAGNGRLLVDELGLVCLERATGLIVAEHIPRYVKLAISLMYHSSLGRTLTSSAAVRAALRALSVHEGAHMDSPSSAAAIAAFVHAHKINLNDLAQPIESFRTFNQFFSRKLRMGARPVAAPGDDAVLVSPADCRICTFATVDEATGVWVKGEHFTLEALLGPANADAAEVLSGGAVVVARLAPQDYHRFHLAASCRVLRRTAIEGALFTVNPIAIRQTRPCVYTANKRVVDIVASPAFGVMAMVAVGATTVGSISMTAPVLAAEKLEKGDEHGYFSFGGSTVLIVLQHGCVAFDADLLANSRTPLETIVKAGERIGAAAAPPPAWLRYSLSS